MRKIVLFCFMMALLAPMANATSVSITSPSGHVLRYNIMDGWAEVTYMQSVSGNTGAAYNISGNVVVPDSIEYNGQKIPVTKIGSKAFFRSNSIITVSLPSSITEIGAEAFYRCTAMTMMILPESVEYIGNNAFEGCTGLTLFEMSPSIKTIGSGAFSLCVNLTSLTLPDSLTAIGSSAFYLCTSLTTIALPAKLTTIANNLFFDCTSLTEVVLPDSLTTIGSQAFYACTSLTTIFIPASVTSIGDNAFRGCINAESVVVDNSNTVFDSREGCNAIIESGSNTIIFAGRNAFIPDGVEIIGGNSFNTSYIIYEASIYSTSYANYSPLIFDTIYIPSSVTLIYANAFSQVQALHFVSSNPPMLNGTLTQVMLNVPCGASTMYINYYGTWSSYVKEYGPAITIEVASSNPERGSCTVIEGDIYGNHVTCDSLATINATPNYGYMFSHWSDGDSSSSRILHLEGDSSITAYFSKQDFYISGLVEEDYMGYVLGNGYVSYLDTATLIAVANPGYHFDKWYVINYTGYYGTSIFPLSYDDTLRVSVNGEQTYYASFLPDTYTITLVSDSTVGAGYCSGDGVYEYPTTVAIRSTPNYGYRFSHWNDGDTNNPRTITLTQDTLFTAYYTKDTFIVYLTYDRVSGVVAGDTVVAYGDSVTLSAEPYYGYHFSHWKIYRYQGNQLMAIDMVEDSTVEVQALGNIAVEAIFDMDLFKITLQPNMEGRGLVDTIFEYYMSETLIEAMPNYGYHFSHWSDGDSTNPRLIVITSDTSFIAVYEPDLFTLTLISSDTSLGTVEGAGTYSYGDTVEIIAVPTEHYHLEYWFNSGYTYNYYYDNPQSIVITRDLTLQAYFTINAYAVSAQADDVAHGSVTGSGTFPYPSAATLTATAYSGYHFSHWSDGMLANPYTLAITRDTSITAIFIATGERYQDTITIYDTVIVHDTVEYNIEYRDSVQYNITIVDSTVYNIVQSDSVVYYYDTLCVTHDTVTVTVIDTLWLTRTDTVTVHDTIYVTGEGIDGVETLNAKVYSAQGQIVVEGAEGLAVALYDVNGRLLERNEGSGERRVFGVPASGTYMIKIGHYPARKVVVIR